MQAKTPRSSLPVTELIVRRVWHQNQARIRKVHSGDTPPKVSTRHPSPVTRLPQEVVEKIIGRLIYDTRSLRTCTLTCRSWYIAAAPHLHHTLTIETRPYIWEAWWPNVLRKMHALGLLPLVKKFWARSGHDYGRFGFSPEAFNDRTLRYFSALANVQELEMDYPDIPNFVPRIRRYFNHFLPTVRSLVLKGPKGSPRQIIYFIGFFQHLEDLKLIDTWADPQDETTDDLTLIPLFVPPLRGWLNVRSFTKLGLLKGMIDLFGGIRFRYLNIFNVNGLGTLLGACAKTLEYLVLNPIDPLVVSSLLDLELSRLKSLRTLGVPASSINRIPKDCSRLAVASLMYILSTITRSIPILDITVLYGDNDFPAGSRHSSSPRSSRTARVKEATQHHLRFEVLREVRKVRDFQLVLGASVLGHQGEYAAQSLEDAIAEETAKGGFDEFSYKPVVVYNPRRTHDWN